MRLRLLFSEAWRSLGANLSTTVAATMTVLVGMFLLGLFIALGTWTVSWSDHVKKELLVKVEFKTNPQATKAQENAVAKALNQNKYVKSWTFVSKEQALKDMSKHYPDLTKNLPYNPLPDVLQVTPDKPEDIALLSQSLRPLPEGVSGIVDGKTYSKKILQYAHVIEYVFTVATVLLLLASTLLIANTIRLSIFSRRREVEVMKLVGATNWFVRGPFMIEGLFCGLLGSLLAIVCLVVGKTAASSTILHVTSTSGSDVHAWSFGLTSLVLVGVGLGLGALGSGVTLHRFLKV